MLSPWERAWLATAFDLAASRYARLPTRALVYATVKKLYREGAIAFGNEVD